MKPSIDPTQLQRLVDGECTSADIRAILLAAKNDPARWEQIAVALLEDRAWQCQIQSQGESLPLGQVTNALAQESQPSTHSANDSLDQTNLAPRRTFSSAEGSSFPLLTWFAMAASLFAVACLGYSIGQHRSMSNSIGLAQSTSPNRPPADTLSDDASPRTLASHQPDYRMQLPAFDRPSGRLQPSGEVPLYNVNSINQWRELDLPQSLNLTPEKLAELNARGIGVQKEFDVLSGKFDDGRVFLVPIRSIRFAPWQ